MWPRWSARILKRSPQMAREVRDIGASVRARLLGISKEKGLNFDLVLTHYAIERLLYRLAQSRHADRFVLKGAILLMTWFDEPFRSTRDLDLLSHAIRRRRLSLVSSKRFLARNSQTVCSSSSMHLGSAEFDKRMSMVVSAYGRQPTLAGPASPSTSMLGSGMRQNPLQNGSTIRSCSTCRRRGCRATHGRPWLQRNSRPWWIWAWPTAG